MINNKKILIIGGTGSLGNEITDRYINNNNIFIISRDETKQWEMKIKYNYNTSLNFIIGDIRDIYKMEQSILRINPNIIIMAAAMKHIDQCEFEINECVNTNFIGIQNVLNIIENNIKNLDNLKSVCFISTDKACSPVNAYGMAKALSECAMIEKSKFIKNIKFVTVRYGNVLNSRGSIIPILHKIGESEKNKEFKITDEKMTRFVMTLSQSVDLIEHAILYGNNGDIVIPKLVSCNIKDMIEIFSELYKKPIINIGLRPGEKLLECLINETQSNRLEYGNDGYMYIRPSYENKMIDNEIKNYDSTTNTMKKEELLIYLINLKLI